MKIKIYIAAICTLCFVLTACQPTPEKEFVVSKNEGVLESRISGGIRRGEQF